MTRGKKMLERQCSIQNCEREVESNGLCAMHARRERRNGSPFVVMKMSNKGMVCSVVDCGKNAFSKGYCQQHYDSVKKHGREYLIQTTTRGAGYINKDGYKEIYVNGKKILEHVYLAEQALGKPLPSGAVVHHMNEDKLDNFTPFNLVICPDQVYHMLLHQRMRALYMSIVVNSNQNVNDLDL